MYRDMEGDISFIGKELDFICALTGAFVAKTGWTKKSHFPLKMPQPGTRQERFPDPPHMEDLQRLFRRLKTKGDPESERIQKLIDAEILLVFDMRASAPHELTIQINYLVDKALEVDIDIPPTKMDTPFFNWKKAIHYAESLWKDLAKVNAPRRVIKIKK